MRHALSDINDIFNIQGTRLTSRSTEKWPTTFHFLPKKENSVEVMAKVHVCDTSVRAMLK